MGLRMTKQALNTLIDAPSLDAALMIEDRQQVILLETHDHAEAVAAFDDTAQPQPARERTITISPGFRTGWNIGQHQVVVGAALPVSRTAGRNDVAVITYFSYELPFR